jgi:basic amino acid/polyamine antiporter, APA family
VSARSPDRPKDFSTSVQPLQLFTIAFGTVVGITWIFLSGPWLRAAGSLGSVLALMLGGISMLPIAWCYARLAEAYPGTGGELLYVGRTLGVWPGLMAGWLLAFSYITLVAFHLVTVAWMVDISLDHLPLGRLHQLPLLRAAGIGVSALAFAAIIATNLRGLRAASRAQDWVVTVLLVATLGFAANSLRLGRFTYLHPYLVTVPGRPFAGVLSVLAMAPFLFGGFGTAVQAISASPGTRPRSVFAALGAAVIAAAVFYSVIVLSIAAALPRAQLLGYAMPALDAFSRAFHSPLATVSVCVLALVALCTSWNGVFLAGWRLVRALGHAELLPEWFAPRSESANAERRPIVIVSALSVVLAVQGRSGLLGIVNSVAFMIALIFLLMAAGTLRHLLRLGVPATVSRTLRLGLAAIATLVALAVMLLAGYNLAASASSSSDLLAVIACVLAFVVLAMARRSRVTGQQSLE